MQPLSNDLRKRILDAVDNKEGSRRKLAARFKVNTIDHHQIAPTPA